MLAKTFGAAVYGVNATMITVEVTVGQGQKFFLVGLPDSAVKESEQRVESAIKYIGYDFPRQKVVVNLAPADIRKEGSAYDLPIALCVLQASEQISPARSLEEYVIMGELSLDGGLLAVSGALPAAMAAHAHGLGLICPKASGVRRIVTLPPWCRRSVANPRATWSGSDADRKAA